MKDKALCLTATRPTLATAQVATAKARATFEPIHYAYHIRALNKTRK